MEKCKYSDCSNPQCRFGCLNPIIIPDKIEGDFKRKWIFHITYSNDESERKEFNFDMPVSHKMGYGSLIEHLTNQNRIAISINLLNASKQ